MSICKFITFLAVLALVGVRPRRFQPNPYIRFPLGMRNKKIFKNQPHHSLVDQTNSVIVISMYQDHYLDECGARNTFNLDRV